MAKLKRFLNGVVLCYLAYAMAKDGPSPVLLGLFGLFIFTAVMQWWMQSDARKKIKKQQKE